METTGLRELVTTDGPFASVYFDDTHDTEDAAKQLELTWREIRDQLAEQGTREETLDALSQAVEASTPPVGPSGRALVAAADRVLVDRELGEPPPSRVVRLSDLPYVLPLAIHGEPPPAHVVAIADRIGADITAVDRHGQVVDARTVEGVKHHVHKVRSGGFSHRTMQHHTEELVRENIEQAAKHVADIARRIGATLVVVSGESQARKALREFLPKSLRERATEVQGGERRAGTTDKELDTRVREVLAEATRAQRDQVAERFRNALGMPTGLAVDGLEATTSALWEANVEVLLFDRPADVEVFRGTDPSQLALQRDPLEALGAERITRCRADEAVPIAAIATDADILYTGERLDLTEGFGALLRHD